MPVETISWKRIDLPGRERCSLQDLDGQRIVTGHALFYDDGRICDLVYRVVCAADWTTLSADVNGYHGERAVALSIRSDRGQWEMNAATCPQVEGCLDIDLGFSPSTNLLPIRRLGLAVGEEARVQAAWLSFPGFDLAPLAQIYRRESENTYHYESGEGRFVRTLEVNGAGFVTRYPGVWSAVDQKPKK